MPARYETDADYAHSHPVHVVWELTLACNLKCAHCGSRAGKRRPDELSTDEALEVVEQLARMGTREVSLIGGEAYLRRDWIDIIRAIDSHGIHTSLQTGGLALNQERIRAAKEAGLRSAGISIDGTADYHDRIRGVKGSYTHALEALRHLREAGIPHSVNTQITAEVMPHLRPLLHVIAAEGVRNWQVQLTVAMGNAADHPELILQPYRYLEFMPEFAELFDEAQELGVLIQPGNNIGYFGPYEHRWRQSEEVRHWQGCAAGHTVLGIEADGTIKGCPSLATNGYAGGNVRDMTISEIWNHTDELRFTRDRSPDELWGFCGSCYYKEVCRGGCTWTSHSLLGRAGNNPYCHYRVLELAKRGQRERIVKVAEAPGTSFDYGRFDLILEPLDGIGEGIVQVPPPPVEKRAHTKSDRVPPILPLCPMCEQYVYAHEVMCPHCGADIVEVANVIAELERVVSEYRGTEVPR